VNQNVDQLYAKNSLEINKKKTRAILIFRFSVFFSFSLSLVPAKLDCREGKKSDGIIKMTENNK
jgi:hypothetical protein